MYEASSDTTEQHMKSTSVVTGEMKPNYLLNTEEKLNEETR